MTVTCFEPAQFQTAVVAAVRAPSLHNSQPWRFTLRGDTVEVRADPARALAVADPTGWGLRLSCGAATYNLRLAFAVGGTPVEVEWLPEPTDRDLLAVLRPGPARPPTPLEHRLFRAIPQRRSNRLPFRDDPVGPAARVAMLEAARAESAWLELVTGTDSRGHGGGDRPGGQPGPEPRPPLRRRDRGVDPSWPSRPRWCSGGGRRAKPRADRPSAAPFVQRHRPRPGHRVRARAPGRRARHWGRPTGRPVGRRAMPCSGCC